MGERIRDHRELRVYQDALSAAMQVFNLTKRFPVEERYSLTAQVRDSSRSVCANIGEAWRKRRYPAHFKSKLTDAEGEAAETTVHSEIALLCGYITREEADDLDHRYDSIIAQLVHMVGHPEQWVIR